jgi:hypothetical protein
MLNSPLDRETTEEHLNDTRSSGAREVDCTANGDEVDKKSHYGVVRCREEQVPD